MFPTDWGKKLTFIELLNNASQFSEGIFYIWDFFVLVESFVINLSGISRQCRYCRGNVNLIFCYNLNNRP